MSETPPGIPNFQLKAIKILAQSYIDKSISDLEADVDNHVTLAAAAKAEHPMLNLKLATLIGERLKVFVGILGRPNRATTILVAWCCRLFRCSGRRGGRLSISHRIRRRCRDLQCLCSVCWSRGTCHHYRGILSGQINNCDTCCRDASYLSRLRMAS